MNFTLGRRLKNFIKVQFFIKDKKAYVNSDAVESKDTDIYNIKKVYYENGSIKAEIHTKNGILNGQANLYYESGRVKAREFYRDNTLQGISRWYYESGELQSEKYFDHGKHIYTKEYSKAGELTSETKY